MGPRPLLSFLALPQYPVGLRSLPRPAPRPLLPLQEVMLAGAHACGIPFQELRPRASSLTRFTLLMLEAGANFDKASRWHGHSGASLLGGIREHGRCSSCKNARSAIITT